MSSSINIRLEAMKLATLLEKDTKAVVFLAEAYANYIETGVTEPDAPKAPGKPKVSKISPNKKGEKFTL